MQSKIQFENNAKRLTHEPFSSIQAKHDHHQLLQALDLHLDGTSLGVRSCLESLEGILQRETVRHQPSEIDEAILDQTDGSGPSVAVAVLELEVDLPYTGAHEGDLDLVLANANDEHLAAKLDGPDSSSDTALDTGALKSHRGLDSAKALYDLLGRVLGREALNLVGDDLRADLLSKLQATLVDVGNDKRAGAGGLGAKHGDQTDGTGTADEDGVAQTNFGSVKASQRHGKRLEHGAVLVRHVTDLVAPDGGVVNVAAEKAGNGGCREEVDALASVVTASQAGLAGVADNLGLNGDPVANLEVLDTGVDSNDLARGLVAQNVIAFDDHGADATMLPEVDVGSVVTRCKIVSFRPPFSTT